MTNHVHLILVPAKSDALGLAVGETHRRYTNFINARGRSTGHLFQSRFAAVVLDDEHFVRAVRYVSLNPVRARLVDAVEQWPWSSVRAHLAAADDAHVRVKPVLDRIPCFRELLEAFTDDRFTDLRRTEATGRPLGAEDCVAGFRLRSGRMEPEPKDPLEVCNCYKHCSTGKKMDQRFWAGHLVSLLE
jgi:putative transposase